MTEPASGGPVAAMLGQSRWPQLAFGVVTAVAGVLILAWSGGTLVAVAVPLGLQLIVGGVFRAITAFTFRADSVATRILFLLLGIVLVILGILCLRAPLQTINVLVLLFGLSCVVGGALELFHGCTGGGGWAIASGIVGILVLSYPGVERVHADLAVRHRVGGARPDGGHRRARVAPGESARGGVVSPGVQS